MTESRDREFNPFANYTGGFSRPICILPGIWRHNPLLPNSDRKIAMERIVNDKDGNAWTCVQAFTGLSDQEEHPEAAQVKGKKDTYWVVCTPSGGAQSVRLQLPGDWESTYSNEALLDAIAKQSN